MVELLKEMGKVCQNKKLAEDWMSFHRQRFQDLFLLNGEQAEAHRNHFLFWSNRIQEMNQHIQQLHERIKNVK